VGAADVTALLEDQGSGRQGRLSARLAVLVGVAATLAANVASAEPTWTGRLVALAAPVSFLLSVEVLTRTGRKLSTPDDTNLAATSARPAPAGATVAARPSAQRAGGSSRRRPSAAQRVAQAVAETPTATAAEIAARLKVSERTVQRYRPHPDGGHPPVGNGNGNPATGNGSNGRAGKPRGGVAPVPAAAFDRPDSRNSSHHEPAGT
jgi:hypothetical protein